MNFTCEAEHPTRRKIVCGKGRWHKGPHKAFRMEPNRRRIAEVIRWRDAK